MKQTTLIGGTILVIFFIGAAYIVSQGRPVVRLQEELREAYHKQEATETDEIEVAEGDDTHKSEIDTASLPPSSVGDATAPVITVPTTEPTTSAKPTPTEPDPKPTTPDTLTFSMATIAQHNTPSDCWAAINGGVYDLSTWVSRHPGGSRAIERLCGTDGSSSFNREHGRSRSAANALLLLKIGDLQ